VRNGLRFSKEYVEDLDEFMNFVLDRFRENDKILGPCLKCLNLKYNTQIRVWCHLFLMGMDPTYHRCIHHGEPSDAVVIVRVNKLP
jgi:predicted  nucleic acid-binding Zn ribbon protein